MKQVFDVLCITLGTPPKADEEFVWEYYDRDGKFCSLKTTPKNFYNVSIFPYSRDLSCSGCPCDANFDPAEIHRSTPRSGLFLLD